MSEKKTENRFMCSVDLYCSKPLNHSLILLNMRIARITLKYNHTHKI